jgi:hypothetical protein
MSGVIKSNPTQNYRPAEGISLSVKIQIIKDTDRVEEGWGGYNYQKCVYL